MADFDFSSVGGGQTLNVIDARWRRALGDYWPSTDGQGLLYPASLDDGAYYLENGAASYQGWCETRMTAGAFEKKSLGVLMNAISTGLQARLATENGLVTRVWLESNGQVVSYSFARDLTIPVAQDTLWRLESEGTASQVTVRVSANDQLLGTHRMVPPQAGWSGFMLRNPINSEESARRILTFRDAPFIPNAARASLTLGGMAVAGSMTGKTGLSADFVLGGMAVAGSASVDLLAAGEMTLGGISISGAVNTGLQAAGAVALGGMAVAGAVSVSNFYSLLPPNASKLEQVIERIVARRLAVLEEAAERLPDLWNPVRCPLPWLPTLAAAVSVDIWNEAWTEETKRQVVAVSIRVHRVKGTVAAVRAAIKAAGLGDALLIEGAETSVKYDGSYQYDAAVTYGGSQSEWAKYDVVLKKPVSAEQAQLARVLAQAVAPARCELRQIRYQESRIYDGTYQYDGTVTYEPITVY